MLRNVVLISFLFLLAGCAASINTTERDLLINTSLDRSNQSEEILLIADSQESLEYRQGIFETSSFLVDWGLRSADRPRALTKWGLDIVGHVIEKEDRTNLLIHLGDVLNNSCKSEWDRISNTLSNSGKSWFIVPGNHDGYYFGITSPTPESRIKNYGVLNQYYGGWGAVCVPLDRRSGKADTSLQDQYIFDKADFVLAYIEELEKRGLAIHKNAVIVNGKNSCYKCSQVNDRYLSEICWNVDKENPWLSFILQKIKIYDSDGKYVVSQLLIADTSSFPWQPKSQTQNAFNPVDLTAPVIQVMSRWMERAQTYPTIIAGHHPFYKFKNDGRDKMLEWWEKGLYLAYLSGDTHDGMATRYDTPISGTNNESGLLEINVGSLLDAPIEYRTLNLATIEHGGHQICSKRFFLSPPHNTDRNGCLREPATIDPVFTECQSFIKNNELKLFNDFKTNKELDFFLKKGFLTQINKLLSEAALYRQLISLTNTISHWESVSLSSKVACPCNDHLGENLYDSLNYMTTENVKQCLTDADSATVILGNMSKILIDVSKKFDEFYNSKRFYQVYHSYKLCLALSASDRELCKTKNFWNSNRITSKQHFLSGSCSDLRVLGRP